MGKKILTTTIKVEVPVHRPLGNGLEDDVKAANELKEMLETRGYHPTVVCVQMVQDKNKNVTFERSTLKGKSMMIPMEYPK
jgi:hypothetical protein